MNYISKSIARTFVVLVAAGVCSTAVGQTAKSGYFLPGMLNRHKINAAVENRFNYVGIPVISDLNVGFATNMGLGKFIFPMQGGGLTTFMNGSVSASEFLGKLPSVSTLSGDFSMDILAGGFHAGRSYQTIALTLRSQMAGNVPYSLFDFMKSGMSSPDVTNYRIKNLELKTTNYAEIAWGYSRSINSQWRVGGKAKFLVGLAEANAKISQMDIEMSSDQWTVTSEGVMDGTAVIPIEFKTGNDGAVSGINTGKGVNVKSFGFAIDAGVVYKPAPRWTVSLGVTDFGFMSWDGMAYAQTNADPFKFNGFKNIGDGPIEDQFNVLKEQALQLFKFYPAKNGEKTRRTSMLNATINVGGEFEIFEDLFSVGVLSTTKIDKVFTYTGVLISANYRPSTSWFNAALTFDVSNIATSMGAVINFCPEYFNLFVAVDYMLWKHSPQLIPINSAAPAVSLGLSIPFGKCKAKNRYKEESKESLGGFMKRLCR